MNTLVRAAELVEQTLDDFDKPETTVTSLCWRAIRIARLRNDFENLWWLEMEVTVGQGAESKLWRASELAPHFTSTQWEELRRRYLKAFIEERTYSGQTEGIRTGSLYGGTVGELEDKIRSLERHAEEAVPPTGMHPIDLYFTEQDKTKLRFELRLAADEHRAILFRIRQRLYTFLTTTERELAYGQANANIFEETRRFVDERMRMLDPNVLEQFTAAYRQMSEGSEEARSHALLSCRRILKSVADRLYPPPAAPVRGADGKERTLSDAMFIARLWQYVYERVRNHASGKMLMTLVTSIGERLDRLNDLSNKGVHDFVTQGEVEQCIIQTYLVVGDLLRIDEDSSGLQVAAE